MNKKLPGRVGDSPFLGCGTYADANVACSLTGKGESVIKSGLSRMIARDVEEGCNLNEALKNNCDSMRDKFSGEVGGVAMKKGGEWAVYFNGPRMPHAVIRDGLITYGVEKDQKLILTCSSDSLNNYCNYFVIYKNSFKKKKNFND